MTSRATDRTTISWAFSRKADLIILTLIIALAVGLRVTGLFHALGTHPDERHMVQVTTSLENNRMNPKSFAYGSFSFYAAWGFAQLLKPFWKEATTYDGLFVAGRSFCVLMGSLAVGLCYYLSVLVYKRSIVGLIAAFFLAVNVFHLQLSRFFTSDVTLSTISLIALVALVRAHEKGDLRSHLIFGACAGLATATKISSAFLFVPLALVVSISTLRDWIPQQSWRRPLRAIAIILGGLVLTIATLKLIYWKGYPKVLGYRIAETACLIPLAIPYLALAAYLLRKVSQPLSFLFASLSLGVLVFVLAEPYAIIDFQTFQHHTREQTSMVRGYWRPPYTIQYAHTVPYVYHLQQMLWYTIGWPLFILSAIGVLVTGAKLLLESIDKVLRQEFLSNPPSPEIIPFVFMVVFFLATGYLQVKFPRYLLPLYPILFIFAASLFRNVVRGSRASK
jgi:4-amino-4-deoxy-L-arabinose transferase-like glycosyltransferase